MKLIDILVRELPKRGGWPEGAEKSTSYSHIHGVHFWDYHGFRVDYSDLTTRELGCEEVTREQYEAALAAKNEGWIELGGGECPVSDSKMVEVRYRNGEVRAASQADLYEWGYGGSHFVTTCFEIIAYRLHKQKEAEQDKANLNECIGQDATPAWSGEGLPPVGIDVEYRFARVKYRVEFSRGKVIAYGSKNVFMEHWSSKNEFMQPLDKIEFRPLRTEADKKRDAAVMAINNTVDASGTLGSEIYNAIAAGKIHGVKLED